MRVTFPEAEIHPEDTRYLEIEGWIGLPHGRVWTFPVLEGRITAFRIQPDVHGPNYDFLQSGENPLEPYSDSLLAAMVANDPRSSGLMARKKWGFVGFIGSLVAAGSLSLAAANLPGEKQRDEAGNVYRTSYRVNGICAKAGLSVLLGGFGNWMFTRNNHHQALREFNRTSH